MGRIIGIDLGTTNSVAAYWKRKRPRIIDNEYAAFTPSVVWLENGVERIGRDAKDRLETGSSNIIYSIKRFMGVDYDDPNAQEAINRTAYTLRRSGNGEVEVLLDGQYYSPTQISAMILKQIKQDAEIKLGESVTHAVITVPAYFGQRQKNATREAGQMAGLIVPRIITEPTAAALAFGVEEEIDEPQDILVYDLGGGTFDVSVLSIIDNNFDVLNIDGDRFLGGDDFDNLLVQSMLDYLQDELNIDLNDDRVAKIRLKTLAEKAKIELSRSDEARVIGDVITQVNGRPVNLDMVITRHEFEDLIKSHVDKSIEIVNQALDDAGVQAQDIDKVLLVGGSTRIPLVRERLKSIFGDKIQIDVDPMQCVSLGAAVQTAFLPEDEMQGSIEAQDISMARSLLPNSAVIVDKADNLPEITMQDMVSKFIGIETDTGDIVSVVPKGTLYPTIESFKRVFKTNRTGQQVYELPIYESENEESPKEHWEWIGVVRNDKLPPGLPKSSDIMVEMSIDTDGILYVTSYLQNDLEKNTLEKHSFNFGGKTKSDTSERTPEDKLEFLIFMFDVIAHTSSLNKYLDSQDITQLKRFVAEGKSTLESGDTNAIEVLADQMQEFRDEFPVPVDDLFWANLISENKNVVKPLDRSQISQEIHQMEDAIRRDDVETANMHLSQLRQKTREMFDKYPSDLLMAK